MRRKSYHFQGRKYAVLKGRYANNNTLAVLLFSEDGDFYCDLTKNLCNPMQSDTLAFIDEDSMPGIGRWLEENKIAKPTGCKANSENCLFPLYSFK